MPIKDNAKKAMRQTVRRTVRNKKISDHIEFLRRKTRQAVASKNLDSAREFVTKTISALDSAVNKDVIKKNTASRTKSRLMKLLSTSK